MKADAINGIGSFTPCDARALEVWQRLAEFVAGNPRAFQRDTDKGGHVTGSAFVLSPDQSAVLLTHHVKLDRWLQLGGHCDGVADARFVALKEAYEESGLARISLLSSAVFDVDIHEIPATVSEPAHLHYDVRYLMRAEAGEITKSHESKALAWASLVSLEKFTRAPSVLRMRDALTGFLY